MSKWVKHRTLANEDWSVLQTDEGRYAHDQVMKCLLMDIREELRRLNSVIQCSNFIAIPAKLDRIERNTRKRKRPKVQKPTLRVVRS